MTKTGAISKSSILGYIDNRYSLLKELGSGVSSTVYKAIDLRTNKLLAIKVFEDFALSLKENEIKINEKISSPFFIKYLDNSTGYLVLDKPKGLKDFIVLEFASKGEAISFITSKKAGLNEKLSKIFFAKILAIVKELHRQGICHLDLKLDNFLFCGENYTLKLGDFGFSSIIEKNQKGKPKKQNKFVGTDKYVAPEIVLNKEFDGEKADIFSLGVILFNIRLCKFGFTKIYVDKNGLYLKDNVYQYIKDKNEKLYWENLRDSLDISELSEEFKDLYFKMVSFNPKERPTIEEIYNHDWLKEIRDLNDEELKQYEQEFINELKAIKKK